MKLSEYLKDKALLILLQAACMMALIGNTGDTLILILTAWIFIFLLYLGIGFINRKSYFDKLYECLEKLDKKYLIGEVTEPSFLLTDKLYFDILRRSNKSVIEKIHQAEEEQRDYKDYIEGWIHEVKTPLTTLSLICANHKDDTAAKIRPELERLENDVELALFYARSDEVYKDYIIEETPVERIVFETIARRKQYLIRNGMQIETDCKGSVYSDSKWIEFILNQILLNCVKYKKTQENKEPNLILIKSEETKNGVRLTIEDNGIGIKKSDIGRIFEKGFTGNNGRKEERRDKATGIGLYLCKKLCGRLGVEISAESEEGLYTKIILLFPVSRYLTKL